jgi:hypothetical protein
MMPHLSLGILIVMMAGCVDHTPGFHYGDSLSRFEAQTTDGLTFDSIEHLGQVLVIHYLIIGGAESETPRGWPSLNQSQEWFDEVAEAVYELRHESVQFVTIADNYPPEDGKLPGQMRALAARSNESWPMIPDASHALYQKLGLRSCDAFDCVMIVDSQGKIRSAIQEPTGFDIVHDVNMLLE